MLGPGAVSRFLGDGPATPGRAPETDGTAPRSGTGA